jgi:hypothetical protein
MQTRNEDLVLTSAPPVSTGPLGLSQLSFKFPSDLRQLKEAWLFVIVFSIKVF